MSDQKIAVGALIISSGTNRVLLNMRAPHKSFKFNWSLWGGMMEEGEIPKDTLLREISEEIGFVPDIEKIYPFDIYESRDKSFRYYTFVCVVKKEFLPEINDEAVGYAWTKLGVWPRPMHRGAASSFCKPKAVDKLKMIIDQH